MPTGDPPPEEIPVDDCEEPEAELGRRPHTRAVLRRAMLLQTWVLLSWVLTQERQHVPTCAAAAPSSATSNLKQRVVQEEGVSNGNREWSTGDSSAELEQYRDLRDDFQEEDKHWATEEEDEADDDDVIVIALVDGTMAGLSRETGEMLWKQPAGDRSSKEESGATERQEETMRPHSTKEQRKRDERNDRSSPDGGDLLKPLVSTTTTTTTSSSSGQDWKTAAVPSVDGRVYLTAGREASGAPPAASSSSGATDVTVTTTTRDLVSRAPFVDARGRFYVGSSHSTAAALDRDTGEILRVVTDVADQDRTEIDLDDRNVMWVGRVDYSVSIYDARTGETDVQFSTSEIMSVDDMVHGGAAPSSDAGVGTQHAPRLMLPNGGEGDFLSQAQTSPLVATPNGNVALRNPETGQIEWVANETFDTPVAFAVEASSGTTLGVDILPDAPVPDSSLEYLSRDLERQMEALNSQQGRDDGEQTIVGRLSSGQLFAMPLGRRETSLSWASKTSHPLGLPHPQSIASSSSAVGSTKHMTKMPPLMGRQPSQHFQDVSSSTAAHQASKKPCNPSSPAYPGCLVGNTFAGNYPNPFHENEAIAVQYHPQFYLPPNDKAQKQIRTFWRIMASWLPPTMALIFVLSFELGRRQRMKAEKKKEKEKQAADRANLITDDMDGSLMVGEGSEELSADSPTMRSVGVIQVSEDVLGFGGHGTVVYKGTLDGRKVAVKRMLKAYHASADREISLLIESDGHPNVVRYFLKEVRGDFVYLALELCHMSLQDLIVALGSRRALTQEGVITPATKSTLFQIASGVRHLHSLRIVHRDLKPANILLANCSRPGTNMEEGLLSDEAAEDGSMYATFERGGYVAKISDMGLGKQLAGQQSSFGISTLANSSIQGQRDGSQDGSNMVGAGPGSVGWQAPEVMALRWSPEQSLSIRELGSGGQPDSFTEASPLEGTVTTRTSRSVDIFSLGCIFYCTLVPGSHPFGEWYEREANIMRNKPATEALDRLSADASDLVKSMIDREPRCRPTAKQICEHPFFWKSARRLAFLCDVSDRLESDAALTSTTEEIACSALSNRTLLIERNAAQVVGTAWDMRLDDDLISNVSKFRTYDPSSVRDCLRLIRNKHHHYDELPSDVKGRVGPNPEGLLEYFETRFPRLLMHCYGVCRDYLTSEDPLSVKYVIAPRVVPGKGRLARQETSAICDDRIVGENKNSNGLHAQKIPTLKFDIPATKAPSTPEQVAKEEDGEEHIDTPGLADQEAHLSPVQSEQKDTDVTCDSTPSPCPVSPPRSPPSPVFYKPLVGELPSQTENPEDIVVWEGSTACKELNCRGWMRSDEEWIRRTDAGKKGGVTNIARDAKFRTRLCNHWDVSQGTYCPMRKKNKCVFAHGPVELRIKEGKLHRWGKLVDKNGNNSNPNHSGGEDTYGAARSIESVRKEEGKWNTQKSARGRPYKGKQGAGKKR